MGLNGVAIAVAVDVEAYSRVQELHRDFTKTPAWSRSRTARFHEDTTVGLIFDDEQAKGRALLSTAKAAKVGQFLGCRATSICFSDDRDAPQVQAADLFACLSRLEAMKIFADAPYPYEALFRAFGAVMPTGSTCVWMLASFRRRCSHKDGFFLLDALKAPPLDVTSLTKTTAGS